MDIHLHILIIPIFLVFGRAKGDSWVRYSLLCYWLPSLSKITPWLPVLGAVMLGYFTMYASELATINDGDVIYRWRLGWLFYVAILLHVVSVLLAILIRFKKDDTSKSTAGKSE